MTIEDAINKVIEKYGEDQFSWDFVSPSQSSRYVEELQSELCETHPLHNCKMGRTVARSYAKDDFLYESEDGKYYFVHLTFQKETSAKWPRYTAASDAGSAAQYMEEQYLQSQ